MKDTLGIVNADEMADMFKTTTAAIRKRRQRGNLPRSFKLWNQHWWKLSDVNDWIAKTAAEQLGESEFSSQKRKVGRPRKQQQR